MCKKRAEFPRILIMFVGKYLLIVCVCGGRKRKKVMRHETKKNSCIKEIIHSNPLNSLIFYITIKKNEQKKCWIKEKKGHGE